MNSNYTFDPEHCEIEPIHIPGHIQSFGVLLALDKNYIVQYVSENVHDALNLTPAQVLGSSIQHILSIAFRPIKQQLESDAANVPIITEITINGQQYYLFCIRQGDMILIDWDPVHDYQPLKAQDFFIQVQKQVARLQSATDLTTLCQIAAEAIQALTKHDRVMVYRFNDLDGHGEVIAEVNSGRLESYLGLHYPATDIPEQARELFLRNAVRMIPDIYAEPISILAANKDLPSLDLSDSLLRGVSTGHLMYLKNMGVTGSLSIAITRAGRLWGLFACHHAEAKYVSRDIREMCSFLGMIFSAQITTIAKAEKTEYERQMLAGLNTIKHQLHDSYNLVNMIQHQLPVLMQLIHAEGIALCHPEQVSRHGTTPTPEQIHELAQHIQQTSIDQITHTYSLKSIYPPAEAYEQQASGALIMNINTQPSIKLIWFRPGKEMTINWGRQITTDPASPPLTPGTSFNQWQQIVRGKAEPWQDAEIMAINELHRIIVDLLLNQITRMQHAEFERILSTLPAIVMIHREGKILYVNPYTATFTGRPVEYWMHKSIQDLLDDSGSSSDSDHDEQIVLTNSQGERRWMHARHMHIFYPPSQTSHQATLTQIFDITERKQAEDNAFDLALEREQVRVLTEFLQDVSHDLRTPLAILGSSMYFIKRTVPESQQKRAHEMENQIIYMGKMLDGMFTMIALDRVDKLAVEPVDLNQVIHALEERDSPHFGQRGMSLDLDLRPSLPVILGHPFELDRCLTNLVENAVKFSPDNAQIHIKTDFDQTHILCEVSDEGMGIPAEKLDQIFNRFYKVDGARSQNGSGLGLSIVKKIIDLHHGEITVSSQVNQGTTFLLRLPRHFPAIEGQATT